MSQVQGPIAFIGGTGPEGLGLAIRFAAAGEEVIIGSRRQERADETAGKIKEALPRARARGMENASAAQAAQVIFVTVPFDGQVATLEELKSVVAGKVIVSTVVPLKFQKGGVSTIPVEEGSAAQQAQRILSTARVVGAFQNLSAHKLMDLGQTIPADVVVCGDDRDAKKLVMDLAQEIPGCRGVDGGSLANARYVEGITALLVTINRVYKTEAMIKVVGV